MISGDQSADGLSLEFDEVFEERRQKTLNDSDPSHTKGSFYNLYHCYNGAIHSYSNSYMWFSGARQSPNRSFGSSFRD